MNAAWFSVDKEALRWLIELHRENWLARVVSEGASCSPEPVR